jgi:mRNA interferase RelE/StbE
MYRVWYSPKARKQLGQLPDDVGLRMAEAIHELCEWPHHRQDVKPLAGAYRGHWRLRVGAYRAVFTVDDAAREIEIARIAPRGQVY